MQPIYLGEHSGSPKRRRWKLAASAAARLEEKVFLQGGVGKLIILLMVCEMKKKTDGALLVPGILLYLVIK